MDGQSGGVGPSDADVVKVLVHKGSYKVRECDYGLRGPRAVPFVKLGGGGGLGRGGGYLMLCSSWLLLVQCGGVDEGGRGTSDADVVKLMVREAGDAFCTLLSLCPLPPPFLLFPDCTIFPDCSLSASSFTFAVLPL